MPVAVGDRVEPKRNVGAITQGSCGTVVEILPDKTVMIRITNHPDCSRLPFPFTAGPFSPIDLKACHCENA